MKRDEKKKYFGCITFAVCRMRRNFREDKGVTGLEGKPFIVNNDTQTVEEAKDLYQKFKEQLPLEDSE